MTHCPECFRWEHGGAAELGILNAFDSIDDFGERGKDIGFSHGEDFRGWMPEFGTCHGIEISLMNELIDDGVPLADPAMLLRKQTGLGCIADIHRGQAAIQGGCLVFGGLPQCVAVWCGACLLYTSDAADE